jgi:glutaminyl-peptide cyclotransferase
VDHFHFRPLGRTAYNSPVRFPEPEAAIMRRVILWACVAGVVAGCGPVEPTGDERPKRDAFASDKGDPKTPDSKKAQFAEDRQPKKDDAKKDGPKADKVAFDGERAVTHVKELCDIGPRVSGSDGMKKQIELLVKHFEACGGKVAKQEFEGTQKGRKAVGMTNLVVSWFPDRKSRVILCSHYDTRPAADQEANRLNWNKPFVSANDGTSGVAFLMELARHMKDLPTAVGVDFVLFDGEEYVFTADDDYFLGSRHFAAEYQKAEKTRRHTYTAAVLFDLCFHAGAQLRVETFSWEGAKQLVADVWAVAERRKAKSFVYERGFKRGEYVQDDHLALLAVGIPAIDVIDFDYPDWHKLSDTPDKISPKQMTEVAGVIVEWLGTLKEK